MKRLNVGIVGSGIAERHLSGLNWIKGHFAVLVLVSLDEERGRKLVKEYDIPEYSQDFEALLARDDIDIISICTPPYLHYSMCEKALQAGKHVVCEKPLFGSLAEVDAIEKVMQATGKVLMPIFQYRYGIGLQKLKFLVDEGLAGAPYMTTIETHWWRGAAYYEVDWRGSWQKELGGGFLGHAIHAHDMLTYIHGDIKRLSAMGGAVMNQIEVEDNMVASVEMQNGSYAALSMSLASRKEISRLRFCFHDLVADSALGPYTMYREPWHFTAKDEAHQKRIDEAMQDYPYHEDSYTRQYELLHEALTTGSPLPVTTQDARQALELVAAAYFSNRHNVAVSFPITAAHPYYHSWNPAKVD